METYNYQSLIVIFVLILYSIVEIRRLYIEYKKEGFRDRSSMDKSMFIRGIMLSSAGVIISIILFIRWLNHLALFKS